MLFTINEMQILAHLLCRVNFCHEETCKIFSKDNDDHSTRTCDCAEKEDWELYIKIQKKLRGALYSGL